MCYAPRLVQRQIKKLWLALLIIFLLLSSCSRKSVSALERKGIRVTRRATPIDVGAKTDSLQIQYLGCGGLYIRQPGQSIMIDPFFSHQGIFKLAKSVLLGGKVRVKPSALRFGKSRVLDSLHLDDSKLQQETKAVFSAHGHYDHLLDVPFVFDRWLGKQADVYVNTSGYNTCFHCITQGKLHDMEPSMSTRHRQGRSIDFNAPDGSVMKVYPILAAHNPHSANIKFFSGAVMCPLPHFDKPEAKTRANEWLEGRTLAFLIDIEKAGRIAFRMFVQSSSCHYPDGLPPQSFLDQKPVDLAILGAASYHFSEATYPCAFLEDLKAQKVMYIHWEDFFRSYKRKPKSVLQTDLPRFFKCIVPNCKPAEYILPAPGVVVNVRY
ncbi:MAG: MBL fold metallo-hydrolase [Bacteroidota bacterium]